MWDFRAIGIVLMIYLAFIAAIFLVLGWLIGLMF